MHLYPCFANGVCYSDHGVFLHLNLPLHRLYFFASYAWMAVSPLSVTSKVSDGWGSAFSMMPMYKKCIRCLLFTRPRRVFSCAAFFNLSTPHVLSRACYIASLSFLLQQVALLAGVCSAGFAIMLIRASAFH
jgi:hypothetical protein